jgi:hypothetical protein
MLKPVPGFVLLRDVAAELRPGIESKCRAEADRVNAAGRARYGRQWSGDIRPCVASGHACLSCYSAAQAESGPGE